MLVPSLSPNLPLLFSLLLAGAGLVVVRALLALRPRRPPLADYLAAQERGFTTRALPAELEGPAFVSPLLGALLGPLMAGAGRALVGLSRRFGLGHPDRLAQRLALAGMGSLTAYYGQKVGSAAVLGLITLVTMSGLGAVAAAGAFAVGLPWWSPLVTALVGFVGPDLQISGRIRRHQEQARAELPGVLDALCLSLSGGEGLLSGLTRAARRGGRLAADLQLVLSETGAGQFPIDQAIARLGERLALGEVAAIAAAIRLSTQQGIGLLERLQQLASDLRLAERRRLEQAGKRASLAILLPLGLFIFPVILIVILLPAGALLFGF